VQSDGTELAETHAVLTHFLLLRVARYCCRGLRLDFMVCDRGVTRRDRRRDGADPCIFGTNDQLQIKSSLAALLRRLRVLTYTTTLNLFWNDSRLPLRLASELQTLAEVFHDPIA
jgi:hypothetical protein